jgi:hypothetical protein
VSVPPVPPGQIECYKLMRFLLSSAFFLDMLAQPSRAAFAWSFSRNAIKYDDFSASSKIKRDFRFKSMASRMRLVGVERSALVGRHWARRFVYVLDLDYNFRVQSIKTLNKQSHTIERPRRRTRVGNGDARSLAWG